MRATREPTASTDSQTEKPTRHLIFDVQDDLAVLPMIEIE